MRNRVLDVEQRSIDYIPPAERHGSPRGLFAVWFGANRQFTTVATGALGPVIGLSLPWTLAAVVAGNLAGPSSWRCTPPRGLASASRR
jgi:nucleobase:cation symporter-1, NCS1 family